MNHRFIRLKGTPRTSLVGSYEWAYEKIKRDKENVAYEYKYHTHPFDEGKYYGDVKVGNPNEPSYPDVETLSGLNRLSGGIKGVLVTPTSIVVYGPNSLKAECVFKKPF